MRLALLCALLLIGAAVKGAPKDEEEEQQQLETETKDPEGRAILIPPSLELLTRQEGSLGAVERNSEICGIRRNAVPDAIIRIVGGTPAEDHEFPWQVSLQWRYNWYTYHLCGATVIDQNWVVTAAHCTHQFTAKDLIVVAGDHTLKQKEGSEQTRYIERIIEHENYNANTQENDIALIKLTVPLTLDGMTVSPVCLPPPLKNFSGECVVTGWGKVTEGGSSSDVLQKVIVPVISDQKCRSSYRAIGYTGPIVDSMICAGYEYGNKDACQGDSGGPFVCRGSDNRYYLGGIVSWGIGCARPNVPGVYTEVSRYVQWINKVVHGLVDLPSRPASVRVTTLDQLEELHED
ncbi:trypsin-1-like [Macrobrachium nipponense]|uniref:trypsin-1-like n=1 Tax=Macrobrachium nipponense TaxID=159736 RepID=UPI0030C81C85